MLTPYQRMCHKIFGGITKNFTKKNYKLKDNLAKARIEMLPEAYMAYAWMNTIIGAVAGFVVGVIIREILIMLLSGGFFGKLAVSSLLYIINIAIFAPIIFPALIACAIYSLFLTFPSSKAKTRKKDIDNHLPYAANFITAMAAAHATPQAIFKSLGKQGETYGEVSREAAWIYRDMTALGCDLITAIKRAIERSPSEKFQEFLQGIIGTLTAGGQLKNYLSGRAEFYMRENRREQRDLIESIGVLAESYIVVGVAMPLFLIIMLVVMSWVGGMAALSTIMLSLVVLLILPIIHVAYSCIIHMVTPKV
ncbi:MAG: type II secretion system F family protein [Thermoplasmatales archaeon]|nr:type II secretion system F family protein [Thermoplasmatales archaeon]